MDKIFVGILCGLIAGFICYAILNAASLPDVWFSSSTGDCVKVLNYADGDNYNCDNLPKRFYHVWVE